MNNPTNPTIKTSGESSAELTILRNELERCNHLANDIQARTRRLTAVTASHALGQVGVSELNAANAALNESIEAKTRLHHLKHAVSEAEESLAWTQANERTAHCQTISDDYSAKYAEYKAASQRTLELFVELKQISNAYQAMTNRTLLEQHQFDLHLPAVHGSLGSRSNISSGREPGTVGRRFGYSVKEAA